MIANTIQMSCKLALQYNIKREYSSMRCQEGGGEEDDPPLVPKRERAVHSCSLAVLRRNKNETTGSIAKTR